MAARVQAGAPRGVHPSIPRPLHTRWEPTPPLSCVVACTLLAGRLVGMTTHYVLMACCAGLRCRTRGTRTTRSGAAGTSPTKAWLGWASRQTSVAGALGGGIFVLFFASAGQAPAEQAPRAGVPLQVHEVPTICCACCAAGAPWSSTLCRCRPAPRLALPTPQLSTWLRRRCWQRRRRASWSRRCWEPGPSCVWRAGWRQPGLCAAAGGVGRTCAAAPMVQLLGLLAGFNNI